MAVPIEHQRWFFSYIVKSQGKTVAEGDIQVTINNDQGSTLLPDGILNQIRKRVVEENSSLPYPYVVITFFTRIGLKA